MSEQWTPTTDQVRSFYAHDSEDEYHDPIAYPSHVRSAEQAFDRWLAQVRREAKIEALREAADEWTQGKWADVPRMADRLHERVETANYVGNFLRARADRMEAGK